MGRLLESPSRRRQFFSAGLYLFGGFAVVSLAPLVIERGDDVIGWLMFGVGGVAMVTAARFANRATTCPQCRLSWLQYAIARRLYSQWLRFLFALERCPRCGHTGEGSP